MKPVPSFAAEFVNDDHGTRTAGPHCAGSQFPPRRLQVQRDGRDLRIRLRHRGELHHDEVSHFNSPSFLVETAKDSTSLFEVCSSFHSHPRGTGSEQPEVRHQGPCVVPLFHKCATFTVRPDRHGVPLPLKFVSCNWGVTEKHRFFSLVLCLMKRPGTMPMCGHRAEQIAPVLWVSRVKCVHSQRGALDRAEQLKPSATSVRFRCRWGEFDGDAPGIMFPVVVNEDGSFSHRRKNCSGLDSIPDDGTSVSGSRGSGGVWVAFLPEPLKPCLFPWVQF